MPNWLVKAGAQGAISLLPRHQELNAAFQRRVTRTATLTRRQFESKLRHAERHLRHHAAATGAETPPRSAFELGTGWYPVIPVALALAGVERVVTFDIHGLA